MSTAVDDPNTHAHRDACIMEEHHGKLAAEPFIMDEDRHEQHAAVLPC